MVAKSSDFGSRILPEDFPVKEGTDPDSDPPAHRETRIPNQVRMIDGKRSLTLPAFEWPQMHMLEPIDKVIIDFASQSIRSRSWQVSIASFRKLDFNINVLIEQLTQSKGSDIHLRAGMPPYMRIDGDLRPLDFAPLSADDMREIVFQLGGQQQVDILETDKENSFQYHLAWDCIPALQRIHQNGRDGARHSLYPGSAIPVRKAKPSHSFATSRTRTVVSSWSAA